MEEMQEYAKHFARWTLFPFESICKIIKYLQDNNNNNNNYNNDDDDDNDNDNDNDDDNENENNNAFHILNTCGEIGRSIEENVRGGEPVKKLMNSFNEHQKTN